MIKLNTFDDLPAAPLGKESWPWIYNSEPASNNIALQANPPKVTIVTPSYNQGNFLEETIRSVLLQNYPNLEYIVIDGGSSDNSIDLIHKYSPWLSYWVSEADKGQADAINKGFEKSSGEILGWLNSDDYLYPGAILRVVKAFQEDPAAEMIFGDVDQGWLNDRGKTKLAGKKIEFKDMLRTIEVPIPQQGCLWRRSIMDRVGPLNYGLQVTLDRDFFTRAAEKCQLSYLPVTLGFFRYHESSKSISQSHLWLKELPKLYLDFFIRPDLNSSLKPLRNETMGVVYMTCSSIALGCGERVLGISFILKAINSDLIILFRIHIWKKIFVRLFGNLKRKIIDSKFASIKLIKRLCKIK